MPTQWFATSGAGKSYAIKLEVLRSMMLGTDVIIIDPENEYQHLSEAVGAVISRFLLTRKANSILLIYPEALAVTVNRKIFCVAR